MSSEIFSCTNGPLTTDRITGFEAVPVISVDVVDVKLIWTRCPGSVHLDCVLNVSSSKTSLTLQSTLRTFKPSDTLSPEPTYLFSLRREAVVGTKRHHVYLIRSSGAQPSVYNNHDS